MLGECVPEGCTASVTRKSPRQRAPSELSFHPPLLTVEDPGVGYSLPRIGHLEIPRTPTCAPPSGGDQWPEGRVEPD